MVWLRDETFEDLFGHFDKSRSSLRASSNGDLFQQRTERRIGDRAFSVAAPRARNRLPIDLKLMRSSTATFRRHLKSFLFPPRTDYVMHFRADCRRRTTNSNVTVTVYRRVTDSRIGRTDGQTY